MKIRDRYIAKTLLSYTLVVLLVWLSIYSFFNFLTEINVVGQESLHNPISILNILFFKIPEVAYNQASPVILLGCILGMGHLATTNQLLIFRISGASILKITGTTLKNALIFVIAIIAIGEAIAPMSSNFAELGRSNALGNLQYQLAKRVFGLGMVIILLMLKKILMVNYLVGLQLLKLTHQIRLRELLNLKMLYLMVTL